MTYQDLQDVNAVVVGSPQTVIAKLKDTVQKLSPGYLILIGRDGHIPHNDVMRSYRNLQPKHSDRFRARPCGPIRAGIQ